MKYLALLGISALAACSGAGSSPEQQVAGTIVECALDGAAQFAPQCNAEQVEDDGRKLIVVHRPDGGFRRFERQDDGGLAAADGADKAFVTRGNGVMEVRVAQDRYRLSDDGN